MSYNSIVKKRIYAGPAATEEVKTLDIANERKIKWLIKKMLNVVLLLETPGKLICDLCAFIF